MGTASTMQIMAESFWPDAARLRADAGDLRRPRRRGAGGGKAAVALAEKGVRAADIVTRRSFENAVMVHAAISGSTNTLMHLPAIAREFRVALDADDFDRLHRGAHYLF